MQFRSQPLLESNIMREETKRPPTDIDYAISFTFTCCLKEYFSCTLVLDFANRNLNPERLSSSNIQGKDLLISFPGHAPVFMKKTKA